MYEAAVARPAGPSTVARLAATAADYGYEGLVIVNPPDAPAEYDAAAVSDAFGIDVVDGVELRPDDPAQASGAVGHHRPETTVMGLRGGDSALNAYAVRQERVDVVTTPTADATDIDHVLVRAAADHGVRLAVDLGPVLRESGPARSTALARLRQLRELLADAGAPYVVTASATSHLELRAPRDLAAVAAVAGFERDALEAGLDEWAHLAERNRERLSDDYVGPGVRRDGEAGGT
jgi:ribonuclease P/MRP protein subunit RPP1